MSRIETTDWTRPLEGLTLDQVLSWRARVAPEALSVICARGPRLGEANLEMFEALTRRCAAGLRRLRVDKGDRVALAMDDRIECFAAVYAVWRVGATLVPLDPRWGGQSLAAILEFAAPKLTLRGETGADLVFPACTRIVELDELFRAEEESFASKSALEDLAIVAFTSGTTANPKGVMIPHGNLRKAYRIARDNLFDTPPARFGSVFRIGGLGVLGLNYLFPMECGSASVIMPALTLASVASLWDDVDRLRVDFLYLVPTLVQLAARLAKSRPRESILCVTGAAPISRELHAEFQKLFNVRLKNIYGMTEASFGIFYGAFDKSGKGAWHLGPQIPGVAARVRDDADQIVDGPCEGALEVSGPTLMAGYWKNDAATAAQFRDGWLITGDRVARDADGNYSIVGRQKDVVIRGGFNIHLDEVDQTLLAHPKVLSACSVGLATTTSDEDLGAIVQVADDFEGQASDILSWCRQRIGAAKTPTRFLLSRTELPRNSHGKLLRAKVRELLEEQQNWRPR